MSKFINIGPHYFKPANIVDIKRSTGCFGYHYLSIKYYCPNNRKGSENTIIEYSISYDNLKYLIDDANIIINNNPYCTYTGFVTTTNKNATVQ